LNGLKLLVNVTPVLDSSVKTGPAALEVEATSTTIPKDRQLTAVRAMNNFRNMLLLI
jgi:hypothetical protein